MKIKKWIVLLMLMFCFTSIYDGSMIARAQEDGEDMDFSYLLTDDTLIGYTDAQTWGVYLVDGNSFIKKMSATKIGAGGITNAAVRCEVSVTAIVERQTSTGWARVTSWTQTNQNAFSAGVSKSLIVGNGYWYRVRSAHYAESDASSSCTSALYM